MAAALGWGALAASSLVLGAVLSLLRRWSPRQVGLVLAFGAGALISAVSFELAQEGIAVGGTGATGIGLGIGALTYFALDGVIAKRYSTGRGRHGRPQGSSGGTALALGAFGAWLEPRGRRSSGSGWSWRRSAPLPRSPATRSPTPPPAGPRPRSTASPRAPCW